MGQVVLDTSVVIAVTDRADAHHDAAAAELKLRRRSRDEIRISSISIAELHSLAGPGRRARIGVTNRFVDALGDQATLEIDRLTAELAGSLRAARPSLKLADALIKASAQQIGAELLTADRALARLDGVRFVGTGRA